MHLATRTKYYVSNTCAWEFIREYLKKKAFIKYGYQNAYLVKSLKYHLITTDYPTSHDGINILHELNKSKIIVDP